MNPHIRRLHIALIGPTLPYRGGIAQYTSQLHGALASCCELRTYSFKQLYPAWLYPGESSIEPGMAGYHMRNVAYELSIYSLVSWRRTADKIISSGCEVAIITWWTLTWQPGLAYIAQRLRHHGVKVVFLCHNLYDHDANGLKKRLSEMLLKQGDAYIVHVRGDKTVLETLKPGTPVLWRPHPIYGQFPEADKKLKKRGRLELLFFGFIRPYKGLDLLVEALAKLKDKSVFLTVVGEAWGNVDALQQQLTGMGAPNLELHLEYVSDKLAANYFTRADVVVLPYRSATGSGVLALAYHYDKPVLATQVGGLVDGVKEGKTGWLVEPNLPEALAATIAIISRKEVTSMRKDIQKFCKENSWGGMAASICALAQSLVPKS